MALGEEQGEPDPSTPPSSAVASSLENEEEREAVISSCRAAWLLVGDATGPGSAQAFEKWLALVRKRSVKHRFSGFPNRGPNSSKAGVMPMGLLHSLSACSSAPDIFLEHNLDGDIIDLMLPEEAPEISLWERLGNAAVLDIESGDFSWSLLSSLHHTEHASSTEHSEDEMNKALEVTVNSGGVVFFTLFNYADNVIPSKEAAAVIKIASSRMATQSERLGYELAKWLGVKTPQARVVHNCSFEWQRIKDATEKARNVAITSGDEIGEMTCSELLEALELSRCLLLMNYVHGSPLLDTPSAFESQGVAEKTASALGRVLLLDLILRNEDRLPCRQLGWRGNSGNLIYSTKAAAVNPNGLDEITDPTSRRFQPRVIRELRKERRANSVDGRLGPSKHNLVSKNSVSFNEARNTGTIGRMLIETSSANLHIVAIDSGVPRRPPAGKRAKDQTNYPKLVELILNNAVYSSGILHEITGGQLGNPFSEDVTFTTDKYSQFSETETMAIVQEFRGGFRAALRDLQGFHLFLVTLYQKLDGLLRMFQSIVNKYPAESEKEESGVSDTLSQQPPYGFNSTHVTKDRAMIENPADDFEQQKALRSPIGRDSPDTFLDVRENWSGKSSRGSAESRSLRLTMKLRDVNKFAKVDAELSKELEQWTEMLKTDVINLCLENNFNTGFFEGSDHNIAVDAYELKVRLEHILERISMISDAANTERPSYITGNLFIGGALAARSIHTLEHLGISHILCLCSNEIGQSDSQFPDRFDYRNFSISDDEDAEISDIFDVACDYIDQVAKLGGKVLVHCFEGRSRSATVVLAYLMLRKKLTLSEAWSTLKRVHRRAQPNDGFAKMLLELDKKLYGKASMEWQHKRPTMRVCPICGKDAGLSSSSLKLHVQKYHKKLSSGSVDSAMTLEIQKALESLKLSRNGSVSPSQISRSGSVSPSPKQSPSYAHDFD